MTEQKKMVEIIEYEIEITKRMSNGSGEYIGSDRIYAQKVGNIDLIQIIAAINAPGAKQEIKK